MWIFSHFSGFCDCKLKILGAFGLFRWKARNINMVILRNNDGHFNWFKTFYALYIKENYLSDVLILEISVGCKEIEDWGPIKADRIHLSIYLPPLHFFSDWCASLLSQLPRKLPKRKSRFKRSDGSTSSDTTSSFIKRQVKSSLSHVSAFSFFLFMHALLAALCFGTSQSQAGYLTDLNWEENVGHTVL